MPTKDPTIPEHTHVATLSIFSANDDGDVWIQIDWDPKMGGKELHELGYMPSAYRFVQEHVKPMLERAFAESEEELLGAEAASPSVN